MLPLQGRHVPLTKLGTLSPNTSPPTAGNAATAPKPDTAGSTRNMQISESCSSFRVTDNRALLRAVAHGSNPSTATGRNARRSRTECVTAWDPATKLSTARDTTRVLTGDVAAVGRWPPPQGPTMLNPCYIVWGVPQVGSTGEGLTCRLNTTTTEPGRYGILHHGSEGTGGEGAEWGN